MKLGILHLRTHHLSELLLVGRGDAILEANLSNVRQPESFIADDADHKLSGHDGFFELRTEEPIPTKALVKASTITTDGVDVSRRNSHMAINCN